MLPTTQTLIPCIAVLPHKDNAVRLIETLCGHSTFRLDMSHPHTPAHESLLTALNFLRMLQTFLWRCMDVHED